MGETVDVDVSVRKSHLGRRKPDLACVHILCALLGGGTNMALGGRRGGVVLGEAESEEDRVLVAAGLVGWRSEVDRVAGARSQEARWKGA